MISLSDDGGESSVVSQYTTIYIQPFDCHLTFTHTGWLSSLWQILVQISWHSTYRLSECTIRLDNVKVNLSVHCARSSGFILPSVELTTTPCSLVELKCLLPKYFFAVLSPRARWAQAWTTAPASLICLVVEVTLVASWWTVHLSCAVKNEGGNYNTCISAYLCDRNRMTWKQHRSISLWRSWPDSNERWYHHWWFLHIRWLSNT